MITRRRAQDADRPNVDVQQRLLEQQRDLQTQRFQLEREALLRSMKPRPLQPPTADGVFR